MNTIALDGFLAEVELDEAENQLRGTVVNANFILKFSAPTVVELKQAFAQVIADKRAELAATDPPRPLLLDRSISTVAHERMARSASLGERRRPDGAEHYQALQEAYDNFLAELYQAFLTVRTKGDDGREGAIGACASVARFISRRWEDPELASIFLTIAESIVDLGQGRSPPLLTAGEFGRKRPRSSAIDHLRMMAAALLEARVELGDPLEVAAADIARKCRLWPGFTSDRVSTHTVKNWRSSWRAKSEVERRQFGGVVSYLLGSEKPRGEIENLLKNGPPGTPKSRADEE